MYKGGNNAKLEGIKKAFWRKWGLERDVERMWEKSVSQELK